MQSNIFNENEKKVIMEALNYKKEHAHVFNYASDRYLDELDKLMDKINGIPNNPIMKVKCFFFKASGKYYMTQHIILHSKFDIQNIGKSIENFYKELDEIANLRKNFIMVVPFDEYEYIPPYYKGVQQ